MPSLLDMLSGNEMEIGLQAGNMVDGTEDLTFTNNLKVWRNKIINDYTRYGVDLNKSIATIAERYNLNNEQIQRLIEEVNTQVYLIEYNRMKDQTVREVKFDIASLQKIKDLLSNGSKANTEQPNDPETKGEKPKMDKKASQEDSLNFLNYTAYETVGLSEDKKITQRQILERQINEKLASVINEYEKELHDFGTNVECFADALIKYAGFHKDYQSIFEKVAKEAMLPKKTQVVIKKTYIEKVAKLKELSKIPKDFPSDLDLVDGISKQAEFSLGDHSLIKKATENSSNKELPTVITNKRVIKDVRNLVELATKIQKQQESLIEKQQKKNKIQRMLQVK